MAQIRKDSVEEVKEIVEKWWSNLKVERKFSGTNAVSKIVNSCSEEIQQYVRNLISEQIKTVIHGCQKSKDIKDLQNACNAINGCFDNFTHAVSGVILSFGELVSFFDFSINETLTKLFLKNSSKNFISTILELLHSLSRILILVLKLKRNHSGKKNVLEQNNSLYQSEDLFKNSNFRKLLTGLTHKIGIILTIDDVSFDTKNNLAMSSLLIREMLVSDNIKLKKFHQDFVESIPSDLVDQEAKENILKFLLCNAVINTLSTNIISESSTFTYLKFFINLCEKYSSDTPTILNASRTLLLLVKHDCFKEFLNKTDEIKVEQIIGTLISCVFMLIEHPVACIRHSGKEFLQVLTGHKFVLNILIKFVFKLPKDKRSYFISIAAIANEIGSRELIKKNCDLPKQLFEALCDPTIVSHVSIALENMILKDCLVEDNFSVWCETWVVPLLVSLIHVLPIVAADIDKLLEKVFKKYPDSALYIIDKWAHPTSDEELRYVITSLKISQKQGFKFKKNILSKTKSHQSNSVDKIEIQCNTEEKWKNLIDIKLLENCLHHGDDDIRVSAFSLLIEAHKSTESYSKTDFRLIQYFLNYNLNNQEPSTRQKILGLIRKMLLRFSESKHVLIKQSKSNQQLTENLCSNLLYEQFLDSLVEFCFSNIFVGCNFNRLNTVLNILVLCFENIKSMSFNPNRTNFYWNKFLVAIDSSYEENKKLAVDLSEKLDFSLLDANKPENTRLLFEKAFSLCTHMEPPDVLTGSYLLQVLINLPSSKEVLFKYFGNCMVDNVSYFCMQFLLKKLKEQTELAKLDLMTAATVKPMYGTLFAIRLIFRNINFTENEVNVDKESLLAWGNLLKEIMEVSFQMTRIVGCVVNSSSPEGHLPMDFQTNFENSLFVSNKKETESSNSSDICSPSEVLVPKGTDLIKNVYENFIHKYYEVDYTIKNFNYDSYEIVRSLTSLLKVNELLIKKLNVYVNKKPQVMELKGLDVVCLDQLKDIEQKLKYHIHNLDKNNTNIYWPATSQVLLLCAWRSIKEACLYVGDFISKLPVEKQVELGFLTKDTIFRIGEEFKVLLCEIKHRGAFEQAYIGFTQLVNSLWKCPDKNLSDLPKKWLEEVSEQLESPLKDQKMKLCSTRRSAGLPFMVQAIICSEISFIKSTAPSSLHSCMKSLLRITENGVADNSESKIHALNILRALFKHAQLGEHVASYVSRALMVAIRGSRASTWSERNSSNLLFSSLIIRIFGVARSRDEISKKNRMTSRTFFQRYAELYEFLLAEMKYVYSNENDVTGIYSKPSLYLILLILARLYPSPVEDSENIDLSEFLPYINMSRRNPIMKIRELGARALVPLINYDRLMEELDSRFYILSLKDGYSENELHGVLLQVKGLLSESVGVLENLTKEVFQKRELLWIENTKWMLKWDAKKKKNSSFITQSAYIKVLHILFKHYPCLREKIIEIIVYEIDTEVLSKTDILKQNKLPGISLFLEDLYYLKTDVLACCWLNLNISQSEENFLKLFKFMLCCLISEVQSIPLRMLCFVLKNLENKNVAEDDFNEICGSVRDLLVFQKKENVNRFREKILFNPNVIKIMVENLNKPNCEFFKSKVVHRIWLNIVSNLVMKKIIPILHPNMDSSLSLKIDFAKSLLGSSDKDLSNHSLLCYSVYLMDEIMSTSNREMSERPTSEDRSTLSELLNEFSSPDADVRERMAVANFLHTYCECVADIRVQSDPILMKIWMIPLKLLADEDPTIRVVATNIVHKLRAYIAKEKSTEKLIIEMETLDWPHLPVVTLKAQEFLLDSFINIIGSENLIYLVVQLLILAMSSLYDSENYSKDEFGVFEKGNPNPYCEELALSNLICLKLRKMRTVVDLETLLRKKLNSSLSKFIAESFHFSDFTPDTLMAAINRINSTVEENENSSEEFSLAKVQLRNLRRTLNLSVE